MLYTGGMHHLGEFVFIAVSHEDRQQTAEWCDHTFILLPLQAEAMVCETVGAMCHAWCIRRQ